MPPSPSLMFQHTDLGPKLCALCTVGDKDAVRRLLDDADTDVNETDSTGETPLHKACHAGELEIIELLLQKDGIDISSRSNNGQTPLHIVSKLGNVKAAQLILDAEPDESRAISYVNSPDDQGLTPLCCSVKFIQMVNFLQKRYVYCEIYTVYWVSFAEEFCILSAISLTVIIRQNHCQRLHIALTI